MAITGRNAPFLTILRRRVDQTEELPAAIERPTAAVKFPAMPPRIVRLLVALVLALSVPIQGLAAVVAGVCMSTGHHETAAPGAAQDHGSAHSHHSLHSHDSAEPSPQGHEGTNSGHCAACVACCGAASISPVPHFFSSVLAAAEAIATPVASPPGRLPVELDRPPLAI